MRAFVAAQSHDKYPSPKMYKDMKKEPPYTPSQKLMIFRLGLISYYCILMGSTYVGLRTTRALLSPALRVIKKTKQKRECYV